MTTRSHPLTFCPVLPVLAVGAGLQARAREGILEGPRRTDFFEIHAENYMGAGGPPHMVSCSLRIRADYTLSIHGVGLSIGGTAPLDQAHLARLRRLVEVYQPALFSEHLAWSSHDGLFLNDLLPCPTTTVSLAHVCDHVNEVQDTLGMRDAAGKPFDLCLPSARSSISEGQNILHAVARDRTPDAGCMLFLDVNNVHVSAR